MAGFDMENQNNASTLRTQTLLENLIDKGFSDRSGEWFGEEMLPAVGNECLSIIERRALSFKLMLESMVSRNHNVKTHMFEIKPGELIAGNIAPGSVGFGKAAPQYLTEEERRLTTVSNRDMQSTFGHNVPNYGLVLKKGVGWIRSFCANEISKLEVELEKTHTGNPREKKKIQFYRALEICCDAVVEYAKAFAHLAEACAETEQDEVRKLELCKIARICGRVPDQPAQTFHEALQSIYFVHLALHSTLDYISIGRLDQLLEPYFEKDLADGIICEKQALELVECFFIKCAERLSFNPEFFIKQDHQSYGGVFGDSPVFLDQIASANNFLQNIVIGGLTRDGRDASNKSTLLILRACANLGLPTPVVNIRVHKGTPENIIKELVYALRRGRCGHPAIYNDEVIIEALGKNGFPIEECRDYATDGCWEPILNSKCDWVFGMLNFLTILECSLNSGCTFSSDPSLLLGAKTSFRTKPAEEIKSFEQLMDNIKIHSQFFADRIILLAYSFYSVEGSVNPTPFLSSLLSGCLENGMDKTWGGTDYHITGALAAGLPNCANSLANIKKFVFDEKKYTLPEVVNALKQNFRGFEEMKNLFLNNPQKFGNNLESVDNIMAELLDLLYSASLESKKLGDEVFLFTPKYHDEDRICSARRICHYEGPSMEEKYGSGFKMAYILGCGTFGQYSLMGKSAGASADGRNKGEPLASNLSPSAGTISCGPANAIESLKHLGLDRFAAGAVVDFCSEDYNTDAEDAYFENLIKEFVNKHGSIMTITFAGKTELNEIYNICEEVRTGVLNSDTLRPYRHISVRVGGYNAPFITLPREQQLNYLSRLV